MAHHRSKQLQAVATARIDFPNLFAHSVGRGGRGALFPGISADAAEQQGPNVIKPAFAVSPNPSDMRAQDEHVLATDDRLGSLPAPRCLQQICDIDFVIVGCGGLGSQIAIQLATLGAHRFLLMDADRIDEINFSHLPWASRDDLGWLKTEKLSSYLAARFSADVFALPEFAQGTAALRLIADYAQNPFIVLAGDDPRQTEEVLTAALASTAGLPPHLHVDCPDTRCKPGHSIALTADAGPVCDCDARVAIGHRSFAPRTAASNTSFARLVVSAIVQECLPKHAPPRGRSWILDFKGSQCELRSLPRRLASASPSSTTRDTDMDYAERSKATLPAATGSQPASLAQHSVIGYASETAGKDEELTISEVLRDPLIAAVMRADGVTSEEFRRLLETVARRLKTNLANSFDTDGKEQAVRTPAPPNRGDHM